MTDFQLQRALASAPWAGRDRASRALAAALPQPSRETLAASIRYGVIDAVLTSGAYDVELSASGVVIPGVRALGYGSFIVGELVVMDLTGSTPFILGGIGTEDGWHEVVDEVGFENGWVNYGGGWDGAAYRKVHGAVWLTGLVIGSALNTIFTLPPGYRPRANVLFVVNANDAHGRVDVLTDGTVTATVGNTAHVSLNTIQFLAAV